MSTNYKVLPETFEVEKVVSKLKLYGKMYYFLKYKGFDQLVCVILQETILNNLKKIINIKISKFHYLLFTLYSKFYSLFLAKLIRFKISKT